MSETTELTQQQRDLMRRYLVWCYKTTKEELDKIDRYFTQALVDGVLVEELTSSEDFKSAPGGGSFQPLVEDFKKHAREKLSRAEKKKFSDQNRTALRPDYQYLKLRFSAVEKAICNFFDPQELDKIRALYEEEMTTRILQAREHA